MLFDFTALPITKTVFEHSILLCRVTNAHTLALFPSQEALLWRLVWSWPKLADASHEAAGFHVSTFMFPMETDKSWQTACP